MRATTAIAGLVAFLALGLAAEPAKADYPFGFVQITCAPEMRFFAIRRFSIENLDNFAPAFDRLHGDGAAMRALVERKYGVFSSDRLVRRPQTCVIPEASPAPGFTVRVVGVVVTPPGAMSYRHTTDQAEVWMKGKRIAALGLNPYGLGIGEESVEIAPYGVGLTIKICKTLDWSPADQDAVRQRCEFTHTPGPAEPAASGTPEPDPSGATKSMSNETSTSPPKSRGAERARP